jgi:saposin
MVYIFFLAKPVQPIQSTEVPINSIECTLCEFLVNYVNKALGANRSAAAVEALLDKACNILPSSLRANCTSFVTKYGAIIAFLLAKNETPVQVCDFLKVCNNGTEELTSGKYIFKLVFNLIMVYIFFLAKPVQHIQSTEVPINSIECTLCEFLVNYVNKALGANRSAAAVEALLDKACNILPSSLRANCTSFVTKYGAIIAFLLAKNETPVQVCDFLKVCHNGTEEIKPGMYYLPCFMIEFHLYI